MNANERCEPPPEPPPELLPCPFCGGTDGQFATDAHSPNYIGKWGWWECACGARAEDVRTGYDATGWQDAAVAAWNRRAGDDEVEKLRAEVARMKKAASTINEEVCQTLGAVLGYPWLKDDQTNFPGTTEADGVCVGDHVAESLAAEAAAKLATVAALVEALEGLMVGSVWKDAHTFIDGTPVGAGWQTIRMPTDEAMSAARFALAAYREAGR